MIIYIYDINQFVSYYKVDGCKEYFGLINLFNFGNGTFLTNWNKKNYYIIYINMYQNGLKYQTKSCTISLLPYAEIGASLSTTTVLVYCCEGEGVVLFCLL